MTTAAADPGCLEALTAQLGHAPPFTSAELAAIETLTISHARDLAPLAGCVGLRHLRIIASEFRTLDVLASFSELEDLEVQCSVFESIGGAALCLKLRRFDVLFTSAGDAGDVVGTQRTTGALIGNPWGDASWEVLLADAASDDRLVDLPRQHDWQRTRKLWAHARACCGSIADSYSLVVRPGVPKLTNHLYDGLHVSGGAVDRMLREGTTLEALFERHASRIEAPDLTALVRARTLGSAADALRWIGQSSLSEADKAALQRFVERFASVKFYRTSAATIASRRPTRFRPRPPIAR